MFSSFGSADTKLPTTDWLTKRVISLPIHTEMQQEQLEYITKHVIQWIILTSVKFWFIIITKTKILIQNKLPKINRLFQRL